ncbi:MAG: hypothetical protein MUP63_01885 [Candidatus Nanohaloarchaeota archaeon QJJ-7]|nr:hypothetical protein [Candidatus Nanohaloarchaeota archaeon QJJ-7]
MELFRVEDRQGNDIVLTAERWNHILKHRVPRDPEFIIEVLRDPNVIVESQTDDESNLYFKEYREKLLAVVVNERKGFIKTAYQTDDVKEGEIVWRR